MGRITPSITFIEVTGEAMTQSVADTMYICDSVYLYNTYGPTEVSVSATAKIIEHCWRHPVLRLASIGRSMPNVTGYVVEADAGGGFAQVYSGTGRSTGSWGSGFGGSAGDTDTCSCDDGTAGPTSRPRCSTAGPF